MVVDDTGDVREWAMEGAALSNVTPPHTYVSTPSHRVGPPYAVHSGTASSLSVAGCASNGDVAMATARMVTNRLSLHHRRITCITTSVGGEYLVAGSRDTYVLSLLLFIHLFNNINCF